eukprot:TRINITY_DN2120_c0_g2_i1.p1 TRINITY_DN2120_c0_g2~~TRINITY_DN2120_c0_g2_i1.p1  ORF type:complete len:457 (+),score=40.70 TRINITY_DN2120_c0_g2_i1:63-1433(+)
MSVVQYEPQQAKQYLNRQYWDWRFSSESSHEWCRGYEEFKGLLEPWMDKHARILILGCGNSELSRELVKDGFRSVTNIDFSLCVLEKMKRQQSVVDKQQYEDWVWCDMSLLPFRSNSFDVVLEKGTLDVLFTDCSWKITMEAQFRMQRVMNEVFRVLVNDGKFVSITYSAPIERVCYYGFFRRVDYFTFGDKYKYYLYVGSQDPDGTLAKYRKLDQFKNGKHSNGFYDSQSQDSESMVDVNSKINLLENKRKYKQRPNRQKQERNGHSILQSLDIKVDNISNVDSNQLQDFSQIDSWNNGRQQISSKVNLNGNKVHSQINMCQSQWKDSSQYCNVIRVDSSFRRSYPEYTVLQTQGQNGSYPCQTQVRGIEKNYKQKNLQQVYEPQYFKRQIKTSNGRQLLQAGINKVEQVEQNHCQRSVGFLKDSARPGNKSKQEQQRSIKGQLRREVVVSIQSF